jgi:hypothetical protein
MRIVQVPRGEFYLEKTKYPHGKERGGHRKVLGGYKNPFVFSLNSTLCHLSTTCVPAELLGKKVMF